MAAKWSEIDFKKLATYEDSVPVISFYLSIKPPANIGSESTSLIHSLKTQIKEGDWSADIKKALKDNLNRIEAQLRGVTPTNSTRSVIIFAGRDLWEVYKLPIDFPAKVIIDPMAYVRPLSSATDRLKNYAVLLLDHKNARFLKFHLGELEEVLAIMHEDVPQTVSHTGNFSKTREMIGFAKGNNSAKIIRHSEDQLAKFLKKASEEMDVLFKRHSFDQLLIGGRKEIIAEFTPVIHPYIKEKFLGIFAVDIKKTGLPEIKKRCHEAIEGYEQELEKKELEHLLNGAKPGGLATLGVYETFNALTLGEIHELFISDDFSGAGFYCLKDKTSHDHQADCEICGEPMVKTFDLGNQVINLALRRDAKIKHVFYPNKTFDKYKVGALLRYAL